jgi:hypothetical protein
MVSRGEDFAFFIGEEKDIALSAPIEGKSSVENTYLMWGGTDTAKTPLFNHQCGGIIFVRSKGNKEKKLALRIFSVKFFRLKPNG